MNITDKREEICSILNHEIREQEIGPYELRKALQREGAKRPAGQAVINHLLDPEKEHEFLSLLMLLKRLGLGISITRGKHKYKLSDIHKS